MSTESRVESPLEYLGTTMILTITYSIFLLMIGAAALGRLYAVSPPAFNFGIIGALSCAFMMSQAEIGSPGSEDNRDLGFLHKLILGIGMWVLFNGVIVTSGIAGDFVFRLSSPTAAILVAGIWPLWEFEMGDRSLPFSYLGICAFLAYILIQVGVLTKETVGFLKGNVDFPFRYLDYRILGSRMSLS